MKGHEDWQLQPVRVSYPPSDYESYRTNRVRSLFNVEQDKSGFELDAQVPSWGGNWQIGAVYGPSGSGKSSVGRALVGRAQAVWVDPAAREQWWGAGPLIDAIGGDYDESTAALAAVGLGTVPSWLRPYRVLSTGEQFRADMASILLRKPSRVVIDEFTSVLDRQVAKIAALAFAKAWRRWGGGQVVVLTPHRDVLEWLQPDWVLQTADPGSGGAGRLHHGSEWVQPETRGSAGSRPDRVAVLEV